MLRRMSFMIDDFCFCYSGSRNYHFNISIQGYILKMSGNSRRQQTTGYRIRTTDEQDGTTMKRRYITLILQNYTAGSFILLNGQTMPGITPRANSLLDLQRQP